MRAFAGLELGRDNIHDETTVLNFRQLLERYDLTKAIFAAIAEHLAAKGELLRGGTIVDATLIAASPSTKNKAAARSRDDVFEEGQPRHDSTLARQVLRAWFWPEVSHRSVLPDCDIQVY